MNRGVGARRASTEGVQPRFLGVRCIGPLRESRPNRRSVEVTHQAPDELQLPASRLSTGDPLRRVERVDQAFGQIELGAPCGGDIEQRFAQGLQGVHLCLLPGFRGPFGHPYGLRGCFVGSAHRERSGGESVCYDTRNL